MRYECVKPLAMTYCSWDHLIKLVLDYAKLSPTRGLDEAGIPPRDPAAFLGSINLRNKPLDALRAKYNAADRHFHITLGAVVDADLRIELLESGLFVTSTVLKDNMYLCVITRSMIEWRSFCIFCCEDQISGHEHLRDFVRDILSIFRQSRLKECFHGVKTFTYPDGSLGLSE